MGEVFIRRKNLPGPKKRRKRPAKGMQAGPARRTRVWRKIERG